MTANAQAAATGGVADERARKGTRREGHPAVRPKLVAHLRRVAQRRRLQAVGWGGAPVYQAAAALPHQNRGRATETLRDQLTIMALAAGLTPDWSTLAVTGPTEMTGTQQGARFEWTGRVAMPGPSPLVALPDPDAFPQYLAASGDTVPFRAESSWNVPSPGLRTDPVCGVCGRPVGVDEHGRARMHTSNGKQCHGSTRRVTTAELWAGREHDDLEQETAA